MRPRCSSRADRRRTARGSRAARGASLALALLTSSVLGCAPEDHASATGVASGQAACDIFQANSVPPDIGDGVVQLTLGGEAHTLAQGAAAFAVDANGQATSDPAQASYFAVQIYQYLSPKQMEIFEFRVLPDAWAPGDVPVDGVEAVGLYAVVDFDANGNATAVTFRAQTVDGTLHVDAAGQQPRDPVAVAFDALRLES